MFGLVAMVLLGCKKVEFTEFNMVYDTIFIIPSGTGISVPNITIMPDNPSGSQATFAANNTDNDNIQSISLTSLELEITSPSAQEFDFLEDIELFISADGLDEVMLGFILNMQNLVDNTVTLTCSQSDLQEYLKQDDFTLRARTVSDEINADDVEINIKSTFTVTAAQN